MKSFRIAKIASISVLFCVATTVTLPAQTFTTLFTFNRSNGAGWGNLIQGTDGNFFGAVGFGGTGKYGAGAVYKITPEGKLSTVYNFCPTGPPCLDGSNPNTPILAANGNFYGVTEDGGAYDNGIAFELTPAGKLTVLHSFCDHSCAEGYDPWGFVQGFNGKLYGSTLAGGRHDSGTIFEISPAGEFKILYTFCSMLGCEDGTGPGALILAPDGDLYGTTYASQCTGCGTAFEMTPDGKLTVLYTFLYPFSGTGAYPGGITLGADGNIYGTTYYTECCTFGGTIFKLTPEGEETTLDTFCSETNCADGELPNALIQGSNGNFYGTSSYGGSNACPFTRPFDGCGTIFSLTPTGALSKLYSFCPLTDCPDGKFPLAAPMQATNGKFYGITANGGDESAPCVAGDGCGTIYSLDMGLAPFIKSNPTFGKVGNNVNILGNNLTQTTSVTFNGTPATFTVVSNSHLRASVPSGATTGTVQVTVAGNTLTSNVPFLVVP